MSERKVGDTTKMVEHYVIVRDLDGLSEQPVTVCFVEGCEDVEKKAIEAAKKSDQNVLATTGNAMEYEYYGETGRTALAEWQPVRYGWRVTKELTKANIELEAYFKID